MKLSLKTFKRKNTIAISLLLTVCMLLSYHVDVFAAQSKARLRDCIESSELCLIVSVDELLDAASAGDESYNEKLVALTGKIDEVGGSFKTFTLIQGEKKITVDVIDKGTIEQLSKFKKGDDICVYGKVQIAAKQASVIASMVRNGKGLSLDFGAYVYEGEIDEIKATEITGLSSLSSKIKYYVPDAWDNEKVCYPLTNNGVRGYQYYLNVLTQNTKYAELFYIFYFDNEEYLKDPVEDASIVENKNIEAAIIMNILPDENIIYPQAQIKTLKGTGDVEVQYYDTTCKTQSKSGKKEYNVEFVFKPDSNGIVCMLYLYYPGDKSKENDHAGEVGYVVKTLVTQ